ncbi:hypothetical protein Q2T41_18415 [Maribacter confluentis]|uniref:Glycine zipper 2TM domain-containing protein n=1 Tax=Maribacter confluentis TaxID=1656093 RepID=A0ABT8RUK5_9FLAO|nr:hypothetical protein [Maribacter confluentis]MDO1514631.1 hypothetical protein [Maribacter confluentis]
MVKYILVLLVLLTMHTAKGQIESDKALHFLGGNLYGLVGAGIANEISDGDRTWTFIGAVGGSLLIGVAKESIDQKQYGGWDNADLIATVLGGATIGFTIDIFKKRKQRKRDKIFKDAVGENYNYDRETFPVQELKINSLHVLGMSSTVLHR